MDKFHLVITGRRNTGKSSIVNTILQQDKAVVSPIAGTTTDPVKKSYEIPGVASVVLIDTAGTDDEGELGTFSCPSNVVIENETYSDVIKAIEELPDIYRDVIILEHFHNYSKKEIVKLLNVNYDTVKKRTERGRDLLLEKLEKRGVTLK